MTLSMAARGEVLSRSSRGCFSGATAASPCERSGSSWKVQGLDVEVCAQALATLILHLTEVALGEVGLVDDQVR
jgi:hypothetical protein